MKPADFFKKFNEGDLLPLYYFYGEEEYLKNKAVHLVSERLGERIDRGLNFEVFSPSSASMATFIDHARTVPLLGRRKIILLKEAEKVSGADLDQLLSYVESPNKKTTLILTSSAISFRGEAFKAQRMALRKYAPYGLVLELNHPYHNEIPQWILFMAKDLKKTIEYPAVYLLQELMGNTLQEISHAMEKLSLFIGEKKEITRDDVATVISSSRIESIFELVDHIGNRKLVEALIALSQLLKSGEPPGKILSLIARQFRMIRKAQALLDNGIKPVEASNALGIRNFVWEKLYPQTNKFTREKLTDCFRRLWEADVSLKTRSIPKKLVLEQLVMNLCA